uniref:AAA family ATPase n=1 Tax=Chamaesiphon sp. VAR_69_metabat_338 TaxID=2964704 RepID=UPI00286E328A
HNFKSHRYTQLNFDTSRLQAIVGQNSSGKTSILQALSYIKYLSTVKSDVQDEQKNTTIIGNNSVTIGKYDVGIVVRGVMKLRNHEDWYFSCGLQKKMNGIWVPNRTFNVNGTEENEDYFSSARLVNLVRRTRSNQSNNPVNTTRRATNNQSLLPDFKLLVYSKLLIDNLSKADYSEEVVPEIQFDGSGLAPTLDYLRSEDPARFQAIQEMLQQVVPDVKRIGVRRAKVKIDRQRSIEVDGKSISYEENQEVTGQEIVLDMNTGDRIPAHAISEGTMLTLGLLTVLMNPKQPNLVLLDDIEQGLHPKAQRELITVFKQIIQTNPNLQIIFTTHSPYIIDELEPSQVHVLSNSKAGFTHAKRLDEHPDAEWAKQSLTTGEFWNAEGEDWVVAGDVND